MDRYPWLLGVDNGVIDLHDGKLLPHDRKYLITSLSPARYQHDALCPRWMQFLAEIMAGNQAMIEALQRLAGYFLTGDISVQILPILYGPGANGKNVFLDTLVGIMGPYAEEAPDGLLTVRQGDEHPTEIADLHGKRLVVASETEEGRKMRIGLVKKITGNRYLKGRFMRQDYFQFERTHKTVLVTNNRPIVTESSNAIWRRLRLIPFMVTIPEGKQDKHLTDKLVAEWPGILAWAVRPCLEWQRWQCDLEFPEAVKRATEEYRADSDHVADFIAECCVDWHGHEDQNMRTPKERVYMAYCSWCRSVGEDVLTRNAFNSRLRIHGFEDRAAKLTGSGKAQKCWLNLTLKVGDYEA
jgi:putative DNA primase/helicase